MRKTFVRCLALAIVIALSFSGLAYGRVDDSPLAASHAKPLVAATIKSSDVSHARASGIAGDVTSSPNSGSSTISKTHRMKGTIAVTTVGRNSMKAEEHESAGKVPPEPSPPAVGWLDCMIDCMDLGWRDALTIGVCCMAAATCPWCVGAYGAVATLCGHLCLVYS